jgi:hypothetical protein
VVFGVAASGRCRRKKITDHLVRSGRFWLGLRGDGVLAVDQLADGLDLILRNGSLVRDLGRRSIVGWPRLEVR